MKSKRTLIHIFFRMQFQRFLLLILILSTANLLVFGSRYPSPERYKGHGPIFNKPRIRFKDSQR